jgi:hypothetical protein
MIRQTKLITEFWVCEWRAYWSDDGPDHFGVGPTEATAIEDLKRLDDERAEYEESQT